MNHFSFCRKFKIEPVYAMINFKVLPRHIDKLSASILRVDILPISGSTKECYSAGYTYFDTGVPATCTVLYLCKLRNQVNTYKIPLEYNRLLILFWILRTEFFNAACGFDYTVSTYLSAPLLVSPISS